MLKGWPRLIFWELTEGCNLACIHCRAGAQPERAPDELTTEEALRLVDEIAGMASPILVLTGGEPLYRPDLIEIAARASARNLRVAVATNGTLVDEAMARRLREAGVSRCSISMDGATPEVHDAFRGIPGAWKGALEGTAALQAAGIQVQFNVTVGRHNREQLPDIFALALAKGVAALHPFLLVPVGCGVQLQDWDMLSPVETEEVLWWLSSVSVNAPFEVKPTCAPQYYRVLRQQPAGARPSLHGLTRGCLAGTGVCFISRHGVVQPCGYLPLEAGNVRKQRFAEIWNHSPLFTVLRDPEALQGKCGVCEFKRVCGGCRARAYGQDAAYLGEEPSCPHQPGRTGRGR